MGGGNRTLAAPAGLAQRIQAPVVAGAGVGVGGDLVAVGERVLGQGGPGERRLEMASGDLLRLTIDELFGHLYINEVVGQSGLGNTQKVPAGEVIGTISHESIVGVVA